jgi:hypothetical protein
MEETLPESCRQLLVCGGEDVAFATMHEMGFDGIAVVVAHQVEDTVRDQELELQGDGNAETTRLALGGVGRDHDLSHQPARRFVDFEREGKDVRPTGDAAERAVETTDLRIIHERDFDAAPLTPHRPERTLGGADQRRARDGDAALAILEDRTRAH